MLALGQQQILSRVQISAEPPGNGQGGWGAMGGTGDGGEAHVRTCGHTEVTQPHVILQKIDGSKDRQPDIRQL